MRGPFFSEKEIVTTQERLRLDEANVWSKVDLRIKEIVSTAFDDAIIFGSSAMKSTVLPDGSWFIYPMTTKIELYFESEYDHGNGD